MKRLITRIPTKTHFSRPTKTTFLIVGLALALWGCGLQKLPPVIRVNALDTVYTRLGAPFSLPEAIAFDREDHDLTGQIVVQGTVNVDSIGYYPVLYSVTDSDGEVGQASFVVRVGHGAGAYAGMFNSSNDCPACPNTGATRIDSTGQGGPNLVVIRTPMGTGVAWGYFLQFQVSDGGVTSFDGGQLECFYNVEYAMMGISDDADTVTVRLRLRANTGSLTNCTSVYVRQ